MQIKCDVCGIMVNRKPSQVERSSGHYCSRKCRKDVTARFWRNVRKTDTCWIWIGRKANGYGRFTGKDIPAHRFSWELHNGPIPKGLQVCHDCPGKDNPACVNPSHLWLGTITENIADGVGKAQFQRGEDRPNAKLTAKAIPEIRRMRGKHGMTYKSIGQRFHVSAAAIWEVVNGFNWKHF